MKDIDKMKTPATNHQSHHLYRHQLIIAAFPIIERPKVSHQERRGLEEDIKPQPPLILS